VNHTHFPKEDHLPDCASQDNQLKKGDHVEDVKGMFDYDGVFLGRDASPGAYIRSLVPKIVSYTY